MKITVVAGFVVDVDADSEDTAMIKGIDFADRVLLPLKGTNRIEDVITGTGDIYTSSDLRKKTQPTRAQRAQGRI